MEIDMKKVVIIGGGVAGLTAGIYLQKAGFTTEIYEKHQVAGGQCTGWKREGYFIDNCVHWLTGSAKGSALHDLWKETGVLGNGVELYEKKKFYTSELNGESITFWRDKERTRREMLALSPEDEKEINEFIAGVTLAESMTVPLEKPFDFMNIRDYIKLGLSMADMGKVMKAYGGIAVTQLAERFRHPLLRQALVDYMPPGYQAYALVVSYGTVTAGNGDIPKGGSLAMAMRMVHRYEALGGMLHTNTPVKNIIISGKRAQGVVLCDHTKIGADYVICACDTSHTFGTLLPRRYMPGQLKKLYERRDVYPVHSGFQVAFGVEEAFDEAQETTVLSCRPCTVGTRRIERISINNYAYESEFSPDGNTILQTNVVQTEEDYRYWERLYQDRETYDRQKKVLAEELKERIEERYPALKGKMKVLDVWTPATYHRYTNAYHGAYMAFCATGKAKNKTISGRLKGLTNVFLASQWQMGQGGLPTAAAMGKFASMYVIDHFQIGTGRNK